MKGESIHHPNTWAHNVRYLPMQIPIKNCDLNGSFIFPTALRIAAMEFDDDEDDDETTRATSSKKSAMEHDDDEDDDETTSKKSEDQSRSSEEQDEEGTKTIRSD